MVKKFYVTLLLAGIVSIAKAQFGTPEEQDLRKQSVRFAAEGRKKEAFAVMYTIKDVNVRIAAMTEVVSEWFKNGDKKEVMSFASHQLDSLEKLSKQKDFKYAYTNFAIPYTGILVNGGLYNEAYPVLKKVIASGGPMHITVPEMYAKSLAGTGHYNEAVTLVKEMIITGKATPFVIDTLFKQVYTGLSGNAKGFDKLKDSTILAWKQAVRNTVRSELIDGPAPAFELKDENGKMFTLADLKGKTVVLDFWATWCQPCKASFPMMKKVQNRFRENPDVVFLFIHCFERGDNPMEEAVTYMKNHQFNFKVLFDLRDTTTKESMVAKAYGIRGIPTKCVIDPTGNLRFVSTGGIKYTETEEMAAEHLAAMIEIATKP